MTYIQSNCIQAQDEQKKCCTQYSTLHTQLCSPLGHLAAHVANVLQQVLQGLQGTVTVVVAPRAGRTLASSCSNMSVVRKMRRGGVCVCVCVCGVCVCVCVCLCVQTHVVVH